MNEAIRPTPVGGMRWPHSLDIFRLNSLAVRVRGQRRGRAGLARANMGVVACGRQYGNSRRKDAEGGRVCPRENARTRWQPASCVDRSRHEAIMPGGLTGLRKPVYNHERVAMP